MLQIYLAGKQAEMRLNVDAHLWCLGTYRERYVPEGYFEEMKTDEQLKRRV